VPNVQRVSAQWGSLARRVKKKFNGLTARKRESITVAPSMGAGDGGRIRHVRGGRLRAVYARNSPGPGLPCGMM